MKWAHKIGIDWEDAFTHALSSGRKDIVEWMLNNGCPVDLSEAAYCKYISTNNFICN